MVEETKKIRKISRKYFYANGKRKCAIAQVRIYPSGQGEITINEQPIKQFCPTSTQINTILSPLKLIGKPKEFDVTVKVTGGGFSAQADAIRHGISKALLEFDPLLRTIIKKAGFLTRDDRIKERKKYGLKRARRAPQWKKR